MMNIDVKNAWITALRSGGLKQARGTLKGYIDNADPSQGVGYCCMGVLACVLRDQFPELLKEGDTVVNETPDELAVTANRYGGTTSTGALGPSPILEIIGLSNGDESRAIAFNDDDKWSFEKIAEWIENWQEGESDNGPDA